MKTFFKCLVIASIAISTASADTICSSDTPKTCVDITKNADTKIQGSFYYTCPATINGKLYQDKLSGNCKNDSTCATLESLYASNLNSNKKLISVSKNTCNTHD